MVSELRLHRAAHGRGRRGRLAETQVDEEGPSSPPQPQDEEEDDDEDEDDEGFGDGVVEVDAPPGRSRRRAAARPAGPPAT